MKQTSTASPRALVLLAATALCSTPVFAQEATTAPPVAVTVPPPAAQPAPAPAAPPAVVFAPRREVAQPLPVRPQPVDTAEPAIETAAPAVRRSARPAPAARAAPARVAPPTAPVAAPAPVPVAEKPVQAPPPVPVAAAPAPVPAAAPPVEQTSTTTTSTVSPWMWIVGGIVALFAVLGLVLGRRRRDTEVDDTAYVSPEPLAAVAPVATEMPEPVAVASDERPWIRMTLEPTATETHGDASIMTYQLIVENEGPVDAHDVQVSSFLLRDASSSPMEDALIAKPLRGRIDVPSGSSVRVEASVVVNDTDEAKIVADARYPLPGGGEGHLAARFAVDTGSDDLATRVDRVLERV